MSIARCRTGGLSDLGRTSAVPQPYLGRTSAVPQPYLSRTSAVPRLHLGQSLAVSQPYPSRISPLSRLYLAFVSRLYLACISPGGRGAGWASGRPRRASQPCTTSSNRLGAFSKPSRSLPRRRSSPSHPSTTLPPPAPASPRCGRCTRLARRTAWSSSRTTHTACSPLAERQLPRPAVDRRELGPISTSGVSPLGSPRRRGRRRGAPRHGAGWTAPLLPVGGHRRASRALRHLLKVSPAPRPSPRPAAGDSQRWR